MIRLMAVITVMCTLLCTRSLGDAGDVQDGILGALGTVLTKAEDARRAGELRRQRADEETRQKTEQMRLLKECERKTMRNRAFRLYPDLGVLTNLLVELNDASLTQFARKKKLSELSRRGMKERMELPVSVRDVLEDGTISATVNWYTEQKEHEISVEVRDSEQEKLGSLKRGMVIGCEFSFTSNLVLNSGAALRLRDAVLDVGGEKITELGEDDKTKLTVRSDSKLGKTGVINLPGGVMMELCWCPPGSFTMGSPESEQGRRDNEGQRKVTLTKGFWLGKYEVTQRQWESVMGTNPSKYKSPDRPVENVSWEDCQTFILVVQRAAPELRLRLPTEAEWEYACRAGTETALPNGRDLVIRGERNGPALDDIAWYGGNSSVDFELPNGPNTTNWEEKQYPGGIAGTHPVGRKAANAWGLHDMIGNVWEWCSGSVWEYGLGMVPETRGGSWSSYAEDCRSANRNWDQPSHSDSDLGFRLCCSAGPRE